MKQNELKYIIATHVVHSYHRVFDFCTFAV